VKQFIGLLLLILTLPTACGLITWVGVDGSFLAGFLVMLGVEGLVVLVVAGIGLGAALIGGPGKPQ
jgi:hypothetical protein